MNDLSRAAAATDRRRCCDPIPSPFPCLLVPLLILALAVSILVLVVVHNALPLVFLLLPSALVLSFIIWNLYSFRHNVALVFFLDRMPISDLRTAKDGQIVKITGLASCGDDSLESSYEKIGRCVYTSTLLYEYRGFKSKLTNVNNLCFSWKLTYIERCITDFYITDAKSGTRALVKAGSGSKVNLLVKENVLVNTSSRHRELSSTLKKWLEERHLSADTRLLRLEEGYIMEGSSFTVVGMLSRKNGVLSIVPPPEPITTGCLVRKFLLPIDVNGLVLRSLGEADSVLNSAFPNQNT